MQLAAIYFGKRPMNRFGAMVLVCAMGWLAGCATTPDDPGYLDPAMIPPPGDPADLQPILFPEYLLLDGYELHDHGHIPRTDLIGAGMSATLPLATVRQQFGDVLYYQKWTTDRMEMGKQSFRILASRGGETLELRAVQGTTGPTQIFLLYTPKG